MSWIYRDNNCCLKATEFDTKDKMLEYIANIYGYEINDLVVDNSHPIYDKRFHWNTYLVCNNSFIELYGCPKVIGYCSDDYKKNIINFPI